MTNDDKGRRIVLASGTCGVLVSVVAMTRGDPETWPFLLLVAAAFAAATWRTTLGSRPAARLQAVVLFMIGWFTLGATILGALLVGSSINFVVGFGGLLCLIASALLFSNVAVQDYIWARRVEREGPPDWTSWDDSAARAPRTASSEAAVVLRQAGRRKGVGVVVLGIMVAIWLAVALAVVVSTGNGLATSRAASAEIDRQIAEQSEQLRSTAGPVEALFGSAMLGLAAGAGQILTLAMAIIYLPIFGYLSWFVLPFAVAAPVTLLASAAWRRPMRMLLLRPFNRSWVTHRLRREIAREAGPLGHIYTLADLQLRVPWYVRIPFLNAQLSMLSFRTAKIRTPDDLRQLLEGVERRLMRNLNWYHSFTKVFAVGCADAGWKSCVQALAGRCDAVLLDLSVPSPNMDWELRQLGALGMLERTVVIYHEREEASAHEALRAADLEPSDLGATIAYGDDGLRDPGMLRERLAQLATG